MVFVLPGLDALDPVASDQVVAALPQLDTTRVAIALPKYKFESEYSSSLMNSLMAVGLVAPFQGGLCVRQGSCGAFVDFVIQKTVIDVNEEGVEAAAVTAIGVGESAPPPDAPKLFLADHAFQFFIYDELTDTVLFEGRVGDPTPPESSTAPLQSQHADSDFWSKNFGVEPLETEFLQPTNDTDAPSLAPSIVPSWSPTETNETSLVATNETGQSTMIPSLAPSLGPTQDNTTNPEGNSTDNSHAASRFQCTLWTLASLFIIMASLY